MGGTAIQTLKKSEFPGPSQDAQNVGAGVKGGTIIILKSSQASELEVAFDCSFIKSHLTTILKTTLGSQSQILEAVHFSLSSVHTVYSNFWLMEIYT